MSFLGIFTMSLGNVNPDSEDKDIRVEIYDKGEFLRRSFISTVRSSGALLQNDIAYGGILYLQQMIARNIDVTKVESLCGISTIPISSISKTTSNSISKMRTDSTVGLRPAARRERPGAQDDRSCGQR